MADETRADETQQDAPAFVTDEATSAGTEKLSVAPDLKEDAVDGVAESDAPQPTRSESRMRSRRPAIDGPGAH